MDDYEIESDVIDDCRFDYSDYSDEFFSFCADRGFHPFSAASYLGEFDVC